MIAQILSLSLLAVIIQQVIGQQRCDHAALIKCDSSFAKLLTLGGGGRRFPEDKHGQLRKFCKDSYVYIEDVEEYKNQCMKEVPKQVTGVMVHSIKRVINKYCKRDSKAVTDLMASTVCPNRAKKEADKCYTQLIDHFQGAQNAPDNERIPHLCCSYAKLFQCFRENTKKHQVCDEMKVNTVLDFVREMFGNVIDLACGEYNDGSDKCDNLGPPPRKRKHQRRTKSFIIPMIEVLSSIPEIPEAF